MTTTSLYGKSKTGGLSQYDRLKHWKKMGYSQGSLSFEMTKEHRKSNVKVCRDIISMTDTLCYMLQRERMVRL